MNSAIGMVRPIEKTPQGDSARALTTTSESTARMMIMIAKTAIRAAMPPTTPISSRTIWPRLFPSRRIDRNIVTMSCTAPASTTPATIQMVPGQVAHLRREHRAHQRAGAGDGGEVVAVEHAAVGDLEVGAVLQPLGRCRAGVVELEHPARDEAGVEPVGDEVGGDRGEEDPQRRDLLAAAQGQHGPADGADERDARPGGDLRRRGASAGRRATARSRAWSRWTSSWCLRFRAAGAEGADRRRR